MALSGQQFEITAGEHAATVVEIGAGLRRYSHAGRDVTFAYGEDELPPKGCGAVLVPWPNRLRMGAYSFGGASYQLALSEPAQRNAIHGLGRWARWVCTNLEPSTVAMRLDIPPQSGWPFEVSVEVTYSLEASTGLKVTATARNAGGAPAPFGAGFHPYLATGDCPMSEVSLRLPAEQRIVVDEAQIPVGIRDVEGTDDDFRTARALRAVRLDDAFTGLTTAGGRGVAEVRAGEHGAQLWFDDSFTHLQVFTPEPLAHGRSAVAIEPMTCPANAFNSGTDLIVLEPDTSWRGTWGIQPN